MIGLLRKQCMLFRSYSYKMILDSRSLFTLQYIVISLSIRFIQYHQLIFIFCCVSQFLKFLHGIVFSILLNSITLASALMNEASLADFKI